jgi:hypothetical protein
MLTYVSTQKLLGQACLAEAVGETLGIFVL